MRVHAFGHGTRLEIETCAGLHQHLAHVVKTTIRQHRHDRYAHAADVAQIIDVCNFDGDVFLMGLHSLGFQKRLHPYVSRLCYQFF